MLVKGATGDNVWCQSCGSTLAQEMAFLPDGTKPITIVGLPSMASSGIHPRVYLSIQDINPQVMVEKSTHLKSVTSLMGQWVNFCLFITNPWVGGGGFSKVMDTFSHVGWSFNLFMATARDVWIIPSFRIWDYVLHVEYVSCVIMNCDQHQWVIPSPLSIAL